MALPPIEEAFSIEKIWKRIFSLVDGKDLVKCRLVSSSWLRMATEKLLEREENQVKITHGVSWHPPTHVTVKGEKRPLEDFLAVLDGLGSHTFPSSIQLNFEITIAPNYFLQNLFDCYGFLFKFLTLQFLDEDFVYEKDSLLKFVTTLLTEQMPNLETLDMGFQGGAKFEGEIDPQLISSIQQGSYFGGKQNHSLRTIEIGFQTPFEIIDALCCLAPKVEEFCVEDVGFWGKYKHRLKLLKSLRFSPCLHPNCSSKMEAIEAIVNGEEKLALHCLSASFFFDDNPELMERQVALLIKTLEKTLDSLEEFRLCHVNFLPGTVLPRMPKVKVLTLDSYPGLNPEWSLLPPGISLTKTFPLLHTVNIWEDVSVTRVLSWCKEEQVDSVKIVDTYSCDAPESLIQKYFPNAARTGYSFWRPQ